MKAKEKIISITLKILFILIIGLMFGYSQNLAADKLEIIKKSAEFEKWENLSPEERSKTIQPSFQDITIKNSIKRSVYNTLLYSNSTADRYYNLKEEISNVNVKNQQKTGACWAFSFSNVLETSIETQSKKSGNEISPIHMDYVTSELYNKGLGAGGNAFLAIAYGLNEYGPVYENDFKFTDYYNEEKNSADTYYLTDVEKVDLNKTVRARIEDATYFANIYKSYSDSAVTYKNSNAWFGAQTYSQEQVDSIRKLVKKHIKEKGAVTAVFYSDMGINASGEHISRGGYYNSTTNAFYCNNSYVTPNHALTIIGWDDNYSKTNFVAGKQPLNDGAYIVLNSWGEEFGNNGIFYVSYDDVSIEQQIVGIDSIKEYNETNRSYYDNMYQHDELGMSLSMYLPNDEMTDCLTSVYTANVYERKEIDEKEYITEIGIYMPLTQGVEVYLNSKDDNLNTTTLVASYTGQNALEAGYHTLKLSSPIELTGSKFAIVVKYTNTEGAQIAMECNVYDCGLSSVNTMFDTVISKPGESYISKNGTTWSDMYNYKVPDGDDTYTLKNTNACIKAFTIYSDTVLSVPVTGVKLNNNTLSVEEGQTSTLVETVEPSTATNKNVIWSSSNEKIATVSNGGVVTGISKGEATITVTTEDGNKTDTCKVTVTEGTTEIVKVESVNLNKAELTLEIGKTEKLVETVEPSTATNKNVIWSSSNEKIATVSSGGIVTGISEGEAIITVTTEDGQKTKTCKVTVKNTEVATIHIENITLDKNTKTMQVGEKTNLVVSFTPSNATNKNIRWESSNSNVATVSETGIITAISEGKTVIKAISEDGNKQATCEITVIKKTNTDDDIYDDKENGKKDDDTVANDNLPDTGAKIIFSIILFVGVLFAVIKFINYRKLREIK